MKFLGSILSNRLYLSALGVLLVFIGGVSYLYSAVLDQSLTSRPDRVTVEMRSAGGLFEGSAVTYRGTKIGKVTDIVVGKTGVEATVSLTTDLEVPEASNAQVRSLSPAGEQYLDFQPTTTEGPYLTDGSVVAATSTDLPKSLGSTVVAINKVLRQIDDKQLRNLLLELSEGLSGTGDDLGCWSTRVTRSSQNWTGSGRKPIVCWSTPIEPWTSLPASRRSWRIWRPRPRAWPGS